MAKIALFSGAMRSPTSLLISMATNCPYTHAAIQVDGQWYHSSEKLGKFGKLNTSDYDHRTATIFEFTGDLTPWLDEMLNKQYGWRGIRGWALYAIGIKRGINKGHRNHFYCFMAALKAILSAYSQDGFAVKKINSTLPHNKKIHRLIRQRIGHLDYLYNMDTLHPISGCDLSYLFPAGKTGKFKDIR